MAVCKLEGMDSGMCAVDISQFPFEGLTADDWLHYVEEEMLMAWGIHQDGIIFILPVMLVVLNKNESFKALAPRFDVPNQCYHSYMTWDIIGRELFSSFHTKFNWKHLKLEPNCKSLAPSYDIIYKSKQMPADPVSSDNDLYIKWFGSNVCEQGGIIYASRDVWEESNYELAFHDNPDTFIKYCQEYQIAL